MYVYMQGCVHGVYLWMLRDSLNDNSSLLPPFPGWQRLFIHSQASVFTCSTISLSSELCPDSWWFQFRQKSKHKLMPDHLSGTLLLGQVWVEIKKHGQTQYVLAWDPQVSRNLQPVLTRTNVRSHTIFDPGTCHRQQPPMTVLLQHWLKPGLSRHRALI